MSHTPGPWRVWAGEYQCPGIEAGKNDTAISIVIWGNDDDDSGVHGRSDDEALSNAHLIAAAPDLLEALQMLMSLGLDLDNDVEAAANAAIAKAESRT